MVDQLRREAAIKRINVSQAIEDIKVSTIISSLGHQPSTCHFFPFFCCSSDIWLGAQKTRGKNHKMWSYSALILSTSFSFTEVHIWSWERGLLAGGISFPKVQPIQGEIFMQCSLNQNSHQEITKPQRFSTLIPPFLALWLFLMFRSLLIAVLERTQLSGIKSVT